MKRIIAVFLCLIMLVCLISCGNDETETSVPKSENTTESSTTEADAISVSGKRFNVKIDTINVAYDKEKYEHTQYEIDTFKALRKLEFKNSYIVFNGENSFELRGTNNQIHDLSAEDCERIENELFKETSKGNVDILILNEKEISFLFDFFEGWLVSIDYELAE